jgi:hypothetical protein
MVLAISHARVAFMVQWPRVADKFVRQRRIVTKPDRRNRRGQSPRQSDQPGLRCRTCGKVGAFGRRPAGEATLTLRLILVLA